MTYRIIHDYGAYEGMKFFDAVEYETVDEAVKVALNSGFHTKFLIVSVIDWRAENPDHLTLREHGSLKTDFRLLTA